MSFPIGGRGCEDEFEFYVNQPVTEAWLTLSSEDSATYWADPAQLPTGLHLAADGVFYGTPTEVKDARVQVTVADSAGVRVYDLRFYVFQPPSVHGPAFIKATPGTTYSVTYRVEGSPAPDMLRPFPEGLASMVSHGDGTYTVSGVMPDTVSDFVELWAWNEPTCWGLEADYLPVRLLAWVDPTVSGTSANLTVGRKGSVTVTATGYPTPSLQVMGAMPAGLKFTDNGDGTATIAGAPTKGGTYTLRVRATNGVPRITEMPDGHVLAEIPTQAWSEADVVITVRASGPELAESGMSALGASLLALGLVLAGVVLRLASRNARFSAEG